MPPRERWRSANTTARATSCGQHVLRRRPLCCSKATACPRALEPMGAAGNRLRDAIGEVSPTDLLNGSNEPEVIPILCRAAEDTRHHKPQQRWNTNATLTNKGQACRRSPSNCKTEPRAKAPEDVRLRASETFSTTMDETCPTATPFLPLGASR